MIPGTWQLTERWIDILLNLLATGILTTVLVWWFNRHKTAAETDKLQAEADKTRVETAGVLVDAFKDALEQTQEQRDKLLDRVGRLEKSCENLTEQISLALTRIGELEGEVAKWKKRYHELLKLYNGLIAWIEEKGLTPPPELKSTLTTDG
jgi:chromosome segregation ATPase